MDNLISTLMALAAFEARILFATRRKVSQEFTARSSLLLTAFHAIKKVCNRKPNIRKKIEKYKQL